MRRAASSLLLTLLPVLLSGCAAAGIAAKLVGPPAILAKYQLAPVPTIVIVKDAPDPYGLTIESDEIAGAIEAELREHQVPITIIPYTKATSIRSLAPAGIAPMSVSELAKAAGAEQVISVRLLSNSGSPGEGNDMLRGQVESVVSVWNATTDTMAYPADGTEGVGVGFTTPMVRNADDMNSLTVRRTLCAGLADSVVKLFYKYKPDE